MHEYLNFLCLCGKDITRHEINQEKYGLPRLTLFVIFRPQSMHQVVSRTLKGPYEVIKYSWTCFKQIARNKSS